MKFFQFWYVHLYSGLVLINVLITLSSVGGVCLLRFLLRVTKTQPSSSSVSLIIALINFVAVLLSVII